MEKIVSLEQMKARRAERLPLFVTPDKYAAEHPQQVREPAVSPRHPVCRHSLDGDVKYVSLGRLERGETKAGYGLKSSIRTCPHCTPENERRRNLRRVSKSLGHLFADANIPDYAKGWSFANFPAHLDTFLMESMADVIEASIGKMRQGETGMSVYLHGSTGAGKTSIAVSTLRRYMEEGYAGCFVPVRKYIRLLQSSFRKDASPELARLEDLIVSVPILVFDDLGSETCTDWSLGKVFDVIEERGANALTTMITSNYSLPQLKASWQRLGDDGMEQQSSRIIRRIKERFRVVAMSGGADGC